MFPDPIIFNKQLDWFLLVNSISIIVSLLLLVVYGNYFNHLRGKSLGLAISLFFLVSISGFIGSRIFALLEYVLITDSSLLDTFQKSTLFSFKGMRFYGGFVFSICLLTLWVKNSSNKEKYLIIDLLAIVSCLGFCLGKLACLLDGHGCYGTITNSMFGMYFLHGIAPTYLPVHPTPLYNAFAHLLLLLVSIFVDQKYKSRNGLIFLLYIVGTCLVNFLIEFIRVNENIFLELSLGQLVYALICLLLLIYKTPQLLKSKSLREQFTK